MKTKLIILITCITALIGCDTNQNKTTVSDCCRVLIDITDTSLKHRIAPVCFFEYLPSLADQPDNGAELTYSPILDIINTPIRKTGIPPVDFARKNAVSRKHVIDFYKTQVELFCDEMYQLKPGTEHSEIFRSITHAIDNFPFECNGKKTLLILSDFRENSTLFNSYRNDIEAKVRSNPKFISEVLPIKRKLNNLLVVLVHQPIDRDDDHNYTVVSGLIKNHLESLGAKVEVKTSLFN